MHGVIKDSGGYQIGGEPGLVVKGTIATDLLPPRKSWESIAKRGARGCFLAYDLGISYGIRPGWDVVSKDLVQLGFHLEKNWD